ncbi:hypothetical protein I79_011944 [Cricetulus griseus]|uniref:Uncharacterized protein n=1 Tax=Cricetulus griseus TaxID=10029 RepID=G3HMI1_CRIGR|nr:hypothetical protein I79_011944 [Cricetulus griseus]
MTPADCLCCEVSPIKPPNFTPSSNPQLNVPNNSFSHLTCQCILTPLVISVW